MSELFWSDKSISVMKYPGCSLEDMDRQLSVSTSISNEFKEYALRIS